MVQVNGHEHSYLTCMTFDMIIISYDKGYMQIVETKLATSRSNYEYIGSGTE